MEADIPFGYARLFFIQTGPPERPRVMRSTQRSISGPPLFRAMWKCRVTPHLLSVQSRQQKARRTGRAGACLHFVYALAPRFVTAVFSPRWGWAWRSLASCRRTISCLKTSPGATPGPEFPAGRDAVEKRAHKRKARALCFSVFLIAKPDAFC